jgi:choline monooxygenase
MFHSPTGLPHLLTPEHYRNDEFAQRERDGIFKQAWHLVGIKDDWKRPGDFVTTEILGMPLIIRRFDDGLRAFLNVCAHRHCAISSLRSGHSPSMQCQYHGWEYGSDGLTRKIPCAKDFAPIDREQFRLVRFEVSTFGSLVFVCTGQPKQTLDEFLAPIGEKLLRATGANTRCFLRWSVDYEANWKVAIENSLEAYHVQQVHPNTFRDSPGEQRSEHILETGHTAFGTKLPFAHSRMDALFQRFQGTIVRRFGLPVTGQYWQHHLFPNLLCSFTDGVGLIHCVSPRGASSARSALIQFSPCPDRGFGKWLGWIWGKLEAYCTQRILQEDIDMYPRIQQGLSHSPYAGRLARSEERIHRFQEFVVDRLGPIANRTQVG